MTTLHKPLVVTATYDDLDRPLINLVNEASLKLELQPSAAFLDLMDTYQFTRRGRFSWSISTRDNTAEMAGFFKEYSDTFLPNTMISADDYAASNDVETTSALTGRMEPNPRQPALNPHYDFVRRLKALPSFRMPKYGNFPAEYARDLSNYYDYVNYNYNYNYRNRNHGNQRHNAAASAAELKAEYATLGGVVVDLNNDQLWVRLFPAKTVAELSDRVHMPKVKNVRSSLPNFLPPRQVNTLLKDIREKWGEDSVDIQDEKVEDLLEEVKNVVTVGYTANQPATVLLTRGENIAANARNGMSRYKANIETKVPLARALELQEKAPSTKFLIHPALEDIVNMSSAKSYTGDPRLKDYQKKAVGLHLSTSIGYLQTCSPGMGKTVIQLVAMKAKAEKMKNYRALVITEANVREQWTEEAEVWFPEATVVVVKTKNSTDDLAEALAVEGPVIVIASYAHTLLAYEERERRAEEAKRLAGLTYFARLRELQSAPIQDLSVGSLLLDGRWEDICADEAVVLRNGSSKSANILWSLRKNAKVATALTATPINKSPDDIGRLISWVRNDKNMFAGRPLSEQYDTTDEKEAKKLFQVFGPLVFRRDTSEIAKELPQVKQTVHVLKPSPAEKALATAAEKELKRCYLELVAAVDEAEKTDRADKDELAKVRENLKAANGAWLGGTQLARMATSDPTALLTSDSVGAALLSGQGLIDEALRKEPTKRAMLIREIQKRVANGEQVLVFTEFATVAGTLVDALEENGINAKFFTGKNGSTRDRARTEFQDGKLDVLVCTQAAERGLTLTKASLLVHYDIPWTLEKIIQRTGRSIRLGSKNAQVEVMFMIMEGTVEQRMANHLVEIGMSASLVLDHARGADLAKTETVTAMSGLMTAMSKTNDNKNLVRFGELVLGL